MSFPATHPALAEALAARGYTDPTSVQQAVLEAEQGRDLLVSAETGSGKTVAYGLALAPGLLGDAAKFGRPGSPLALVIAPTRELAIQVQNELVWLYANAGARIITCVGGMDPRRESRNLSDGAHIVVGTPGRLRDHLERGNLDTSSLQAVVLDEADEMLDLGFREDLEFILETTPAERRTLLFSATLAREIVSLAKRYQMDALRIDTAPKNKQHADIEYRAMEVAPHDLTNAVVNTLRFYDAKASIVFCATREGVKHLHSALIERGFSAVALSGELSQHERNNAVSSLREGRARICVATDVAARGLDLPELSLVIHHDLPTDRAILLHRSGRTGRAGRKGVAVVLAPYTRRRRAEQLLSMANVQAAWSGAPSAAEIRAKDGERMMADPIFSEEPTPEDMVASVALLEGRTPELLAALLVKLYRARLPEPEDLYERPVRAPQGEAREKRPRRGNDEPRESSESAAPTETGSDERHNFDDAIWFRMNVGRQQNADARWLLPLICRVGHITRREVGAIRIFDRETRFAVARVVSNKFETMISEQENPEVAIERAESHERRIGAPPPPQDGAPPRRSFKPREEGGEQKRSYKPREEASGERSYKPREDRPFKPREEGARAERPFVKPREEGARAERPFKPREEGARAERPARAGAGERTFKPKAGFKRDDGKRTKHVPGAKSTRKRK